MIIDIYRSTKNTNAFFATLSQDKNLKVLQERAAKIDDAFNSIQEHDIGLNLEVTKEILGIDPNSLVEQINEQSFGLAYVKR